jgi:hypothetical protein
MPFGESTSRRVEATYSTPDVVAQRRAIRAALDLAPDDHLMPVPGNENHMRVQDGHAMPASAYVLV